MAKPTWVQVNKSSGTGNGTIAVSASAHTGRKERTGTLTVTNQNGSKPNKTISIKQSAKATFVSVNPVAEQPVTGGIVTITGKSNCYSLEFMVENGNTVLFPNKISINGGAEVNYTGQMDVPMPIPNDPGGANEYTWSMKITLPENKKARKDGWYVLVRESNVESTSVTISQAAAASSLSLNPTSLTLVTAGTAQNVAVTSNDSWTVT